MSVPARIDTHSHIFPEFYISALQDGGYPLSDGLAVPSWSLESHLEMMSTLNIEKAILSISSPGTSVFVNNKTFNLELNQQCNDYAANLSLTYPDKFGYWASLPLPYIEETVDLIGPSLEAGANGFVLETNYQGYYLGNALFDPVFEELNAHNSTVMIHPTTPQMWYDNSTLLDALPLGSEYPTSMFEFLFDTTRAIINLFLSDTISRYPNITYVISHAGAVIPPLISRFTAFTSLVPGVYPNLTEAEVIATFNRQFYFDIAGFPFPSQIVGLVRGSGVTVDRLLYGSDYPFTPVSVIVSLGAEADNATVGLFGLPGRDKIYLGNVRKLLNL